MIVRSHVNNGAVINYSLIEELDKVVDKFAKQNKPAQDAITFYCGVSKIEVPIKIGKFNTARYSLVELKPQTGWKQQLRRHMKPIFHSIIGDNTNMVISIKIVLLLIILVLNGPCFMLLCLKLLILHTMLNNYRG